jgi:uncharacterized protein involved in exopolysaccharide biosynthesis
MLEKTAPDQEAGITFRDLAALLWSRRWFIVAVTVLGTVVVTSSSYLVARKYKATVLVAALDNPGSNGQAGGVGKLASQFGGLASLAGISMNSDSKKSESIAVLQSEALTEDFIKKNDLLPVLYPKLWDPVAKKWTVTDPSKMPSLWKANLMFKTKIRGVVTDTKTGLVTVSITWTDAKVAAQWANTLVRMANDYLRTQAIDEGERNIAYLTEQAPKMDVVGVKEAMFSLLQDEINKVMLARGSVDYALKVLDPAFVPEMTSSPKRFVWLFVAMAMSLFMSSFYVFLANAWRGDKGEEV